MIFPSRIQQTVCAAEPSQSLTFEVFTRTEKRPEGDETATCIAGDRWLKDIVEMTAEEYRDFMVEQGILQEEIARRVSSSLFSKASRITRMPRLMGVINATPDSFFPGSRIHGNLPERIDRVMGEKPDIVDIGGESTRPGSSPVSPDEEISRIRPVLEYITQNYKVPVSVDTKNPKTAEFATQFGIKYLNDVSGFRNPEMVRIAEENGLHCIVMHMKGEPGTMQNVTSYDDLIMELSMFFQKKAADLVQAGISDSRIILDPGVGFGKGLAGNLDIIRNIGCLNLGFPLLVGASRKSFIGRLTGKTVEERLGGTVASSIFMASQGVDILRVHDVAQNRSALDVYSALLEGA